MVSGALELVFESALQTLRDQLGVLTHLFTLHGDGDEQALYRFDHRRSQK